MEGSLRPPLKQFYRGDGDGTSDHGTFPVEVEGRYRIRARCEMLSDVNGEGVARYSSKIWANGDVEPADWDWVETQTSDTALRSGGVALLAHHVDATFGDVTVGPLNAQIDAI